MPEAVAVPLRVAVVGLNSLGVAAAKAVASDRGLRLAALVDVSATGKTAGDYGVDVATDVSVLDDIEAVDAIDVAILCTGPHLDRAAPTLRQLMFKKAHVVSQCEDMVWPWLRHPHLSDVLGGEARRAGVSLISTGGDAGLPLMAVPLTLVTTLPGVRRVNVWRGIDASSRDSAGRRAIGAGLTSAKFRELIHADRIGRLGVGEAAVLIAQALGRHPMRTDIAVRVEPVLAAGGASITGLRSVATFAGSDLDITVELAIACDLPDVGDRVHVDGERRADVTTSAGPGDTSEVVAALLRAAHATSHLPPGLRTMLDLPPTRIS